MTRSALDGYQPAGQVTACRSENVRPGVIPGAAFIPLDRLNVRSSK
jgi:hypothetical protein